MEIIISHPTGNQCVRAVIDAFSKEGLLAEFHTTLAVKPDDAWLKLLPGKVRKECLRRSYAIPSNQIHTHPLLEIARMVLPKIGWKSAVLHETGWASVDAVYNNIDNNVAKRMVSLKKQPDAVYAYEDGAVHSFKKAKELGIACLYDLPIGYWRAAQFFLKAEQERWPDWATTLPGFKDSELKLARKDEELRLADEIFVASSFTKKTLEYYPGKLSKVKVIPYGFPPVTASRIYDIKLSKTRPLKLLFVGGLSQRKGIADLFAAVNSFGDKVELTIVGNKATNDCVALNEALKTYKWIPSLPHHAILELMRENDVLMFPSLFEGFGLVITEAMAQGTPVITTERTVGLDIITNGENGWLIEAGSTERLQDAIAHLLTKPMEIAAAGRAAAETAKQRPWAVYEMELINAIIGNN